MFCFKVFNGSGIGMDRDWDGNGIAGGFMEGVCLLFNELPGTTVHLGH